ncbi:T9SS type A sorting domain-containing protein [Chitinophaga sp. HK235]|uniref:T9SS type A sorting domain-containing protein n=1 Tax=Chitinophaga sp. HK235 TaxID=2952571 RepID=UPI001BA9F3B0|nr:T9SS type A sorting domain-containing protein [Chitinophaga sp. HK235]
MKTNPAGFQRYWKLFSAIMCFILLHGSAWADNHPPQNIWTVQVVAIRGFDQHADSIYFPQYNTINGTCVRRFMFRVYIGDTITMVLHKNPIINDTNLYDIDLYSNDTLQTANFYSQLAVDDTVRFVFHEKSVKRLSLWYNDGSGDQNPANVTFTVIPKIEKVWVEAPEICPENFIKAGADYHFNVKTWPYSLKDVMNNAPLVPYYVDANHQCEYIEQYLASISCDAVWGPAHGVGIYRGSIYDATTAPDPTDHYFTYSDMLILLQSGNLGLAGLINVRVNDGIREIALPAPLVVQSDISQPDPVNNIPGSSYHLYDYTVSGNEVWTPGSNPLNNLYGTGGSIIRIEHGLTIPPGASLKIKDMSVEFGPEAYARIKAAPNASSYAGFLKLENATLTAFHPCGIEKAMWMGVIAEGNNSLDQKMHGAYKYYQGTLMMDKSTLSYAVDGFMSTDLNNFVQKSGGIILANNCRFYNNSRSISFNHYLNTYTFNGQTYKSPYNAHFYNCDFLVDRQLSGPFRGFISGWEVRGVQIGGCRFINSSGVKTPLNYGVVGMDFGVTIGNYGSIPCQFTNLDEAVTVQATSPTYGYLKVTGATFDNNKKGVWAQGLIVPQIQYNTFNVPKGIPPSPGAPGFLGNIGVQVMGGSGFRISENSFKGDYPFYNIGVLVWNTGSGNNVVQRNTYNYIGTANLSNYRNRAILFAPKGLLGLQFRCNTNKAVLYDIVARGANPIFDGMASSQGSAGFATANILSYGGGYQEVYNRIDEVGKVNYYYNANTVNQQPMNYHTNNVKIFAVTGSKNNCPEDKDQSWGDPTVPFPTIPPYALHRMMADTTSDLCTDSLKFYLSQWQDPYADLAYVDLLIDNGNIPEANTTYNGIVSKYQLAGDEAEEFNNWGRSLISLRIALAGKGLTGKDLTADQVNTLQTIATKASMWARLRAQSWLRLFDDRISDNTVLYPLEDSSTVRKLQQAVTEARTENKVYPNPVTDVLQISYAVTRENSIVFFELTDMTGKIVMRRQLRNRTEQITTTGLPAGIYLYRVLEDRKVEMEGKIIKQ